MLARQYRLPSAFVSRVHAKGSLKRGYGLMIKKLPTRQTVSRVAVVVPKKIDKRAVKRNQIKRQISSYIRPYLDELTQPSDIVITITRNQPIEQVIRELELWLKN